MIFEVVWKNGVYPLEYGDLVIIDPRQRDIKELWLIRVQDRKPICVSLLNWQEMIRWKYVVPASKNAQILYSDNL